MANIETWCSDGALKVRVCDPSYDRCIVIEVGGHRHSGSVRMTVAEAVELRNELSQAITEAATAAAKAVQTEGAAA